MTAPVVIDLPFPPSVNAIWRSTVSKKGKPQVYLNPAYKAWKRECDGILMATRPRPRVRGHFSAVIHLAEKRRRKNTDADNRIKGVLDWLQRAGVIDNDALADEVAVYWADTTDGCSVFLFQLSLNIPEAA